MRIYVLNQSQSREFSLNYVGKHIKQLHLFTRGLCIFLIFILCPVFNGLLKSNPLISASFFNKSPSRAILKSSPSLKWYRPSPSISPDIQITICLFIKFSLTAARGHLSSGARMAYLVKANIKHENRSTINRS